MNLKKRNAGESAVDAHDPELESSAYTVRAVARLLGIPTATLRSWTRRYGIGPTSHRPGRHRLYTDADIAVLQRMHALIDEGQTPAQAARKAIAANPRPPTDSGALLAAALRLDAPAATRIVDDHLVHHGVIETWDSLCRPVFNAIDARQTAGQNCIDVEHMLSWIVTRCLQRVQLLPGEAAATVVLACTDEESHSLPLEALRAALCENGVAVLMLGASVPHAALTDLLVHRRGVAKVVLWAQTSRTADVDAVRAILEADVGALVAGPGWDAVELPKPARWVNGLRDAVDQLL
ncbi:MerR family transcriptional regulator [Antrihabitans sp. YC2-6]|uniref:MerR family transcriptional regulator n=1 Tax=Antrihabitans sp. YC2-6 TaxID=2799498 RepID=UPI001F28C6D9|nr:MerR family transcriptional regulator [Antrihabitans sp. YC2-6]